MNRYRVRVMIRGPEEEIDTIEETVACDDVNRPRGHIIRLTWEEIDISDDVSPPNLVCDQLLPVITGLNPEMVLVSMRDTDTGVWGIEPVI